MSRKRQTRRAALRHQKVFPAGTLAALLTAVVVTLLGVCMRIDSFTILTRATVSALVLGSIVSVGVGVIRMADSDYKDGTASK